MTTAANAPPDGTLRLDERSWSQRQSLIAIG
jgi:hypothetical protein